MNEELNKAIQAAKELAEDSTLISAFKYKDSYILHYRVGPEDTYSDFCIEVDKKGKCSFFDFVKKCFIDKDEELDEASENRIWFNQNE